jgi:hypothetical protein
LLIFDPKKYYNRLSHPGLSRSISARLFLFPELKISLKGLIFANVAEFKEDIADELKKVQKEEFLAAIQKMYDRAKACICASGAYFEFKTVMCFPHVSSIKKKFTSKTFGPHCVILGIELRKFISLLIRLII